jgi:P-type Cu2+ transporter
MSSTSCHLCGLPCGKHPLSTSLEEAEHFFCCLGCMNVYVILSESGVTASGQDLRETELYKRGLQLGLISQSGGEGLEAEAAPVKQTPTADANLCELVLQVEGMWCNSCAWLIEHAVNSLPGVTRAEASFATDLVRVQYHPQLLPPDRVTQRINNLGYKASPFTPGAERDAAENRDLLLRFGLAAFFWLNIMTFSLAIYVSYFEQITDSVRHYMPFVLMALATPVVFYCGYPIHRLAVLGLRNRALRMESLLSLGVFTAYFFSVVQAFRGASHVYFDTASVIVTFLLAGKLIERGAKARTSQWITLLHRMAPNKVRLLADGREHFVSVDALEPGQSFVVKAGERFPADGTVESGNSHSDESLLTGEATPVAKHPGAAVIAGSVNLDGVLHVQATLRASHSTLSRIIALVENALGNRSPLERAVDRVSRIFVPSVVVIAVLTFAVCWLGGFTTFGTALMRGITVLVIACPCALGLATPLAITAALGAASRRGILISDMRILETLGRVNHIVLDKTGTMTEGHFQLLGCELIPDFCSSPAWMQANAANSEQDGLPADFPFDLSSPSYEHTFALLASLEQYSEHPLGKAIVAFARERDIALGEAASVEIHKGLGITGMVDGKSMFLGGRRLTEQMAIPIDSRSELVARRWECEGRTVTFFGWDGGLQGCLAFGDTPRSHAFAMIAELRNRGIEPHLISGDSRVTTEAVARQLGVESFRPDVMPEQKAEVVREWKKSGAVVAMLGDGINDAPALAEADLGIAMGSGTDIAMRASSVVLMDNDLRKIPEIFDLARKALRIVRQNLFWAFFFNTAGISLAIAGILSPIFAAVAMLLSSLSVVGNSLRISRSPRQS